MSIQVHNYDLHPHPYTREELEDKYGRENVWDTKEMTDMFSVINFGAPIVRVKLIKLGPPSTYGTLEFQHSPRFYYNWVED